MGGEWGGGGGEGHPAEAQLFLLEVRNLCCCEICSIKQVSHKAGLKLTTDEQNVTLTESRALIWVWIGQNMRANLSQKTKIKPPFLNALLIEFYIFRMSNGHFITYMFCVILTVLTKITDRSIDQRIFRRSIV